MIPDVTPNGVFYLPPTGWLTSFYNPPTFSAMHARKLADKDGQIHCYYCRKVLQQLH